MLTGVHYPGTAKSQAMEVPQRGWLPHFLQKGAQNNGTLPSPAILTPHQALRTRKAIELADRFYTAAIENHLADDKAVKSVLKQVQRQNLHREFEKAVNWELQLDGRPPQSIEEVLKKGFNSNPFEKVVFSSSLDECLDIWRRGNPTYRSNSLSYRLRGMWGALEHFGQVIKAHPIPSVLIMAGVTVVGHLKPMLGALSATAIMGISGLAVLKHELNAAKIPQMNERKAEHFKKSGENLSAFLLTLLGIKGMDKTYRSGYAMLKQPPTPKPGVGRPSLLNRLGKVLMHKDKHNPMTTKELAMFVMGLADDSLLPFNYAANKLEQRKAKHDPQGLY